MRKSLPISIDLRITSRCNLNCSFCFGTNCKGQEIQFNEWRTLLDKFWENGVAFIIITGGEPTLHKNLPQLLEYAKTIGFKIALSTNALFPAYFPYDSLKHIDFLSLPLDGENYSACKDMRGLRENDYNKVLDCIRQFKKDYPQKGLKIGTVVTKKNMNSIKGIFHQIADYADIWKLYQVSKHAKNENIYDDELAISDFEFDQLCFEVKEKYINKQENMKFATYRNADRSGKYLFCEPNADALVINNGEEMIIGNFITNFEAVVKNWTDFVNIELMENNIQSTYLL